MESLGVTLWVEEPTPWCSRMVVVPKWNGAILICVDLKPLNQSIIKKSTLYQKWIAYWQMPRYLAWLLMCWFLATTMTNTTENSKQFWIDYRPTEVHFGVHPDPEKTRAIEQIRSCWNESCHRCLIIRAWISTPTAMYHLTSKWKPVSFASRTPNVTHKWNSKEASGACKKFSPCLLWKPFQVYTDHKPLVILLGSKEFNSLPPRISRFQLRLNRFQYSI